MGQDTEAAFKTVMETTRHKSRLVRLSTTIEQLQLARDGADETLVASINDVIKQATAIQKNLELLPASTIPEVARGGQPQIHGEPEAAGTLTIDQIVAGQSTDEGVALGTWPTGTAAPNPSASAELLPSQTGGNGPQSPGISKAAPLATYPI